jgi:hypothetical protein
LTQARGLVRGSARRTGGSGSSRRDSEGSGIRDGVAGVPGTARGGASGVFGRRAKSDTMGTR